MSDTVLTLEAARITGQVRVQARLHASPIVGVHTLEPLVRIVADVVFGRSHERFPSGRQMNSASLQVPIPESVVRVLCGQCVALPARAVLFLGLLPQQLRLNPGQAGSEVHLRSRDSNGDTFGVAHGQPANEHPAEGP